MSESESPGTRDWWHTVPGILTALAGVISAVAALFVALHQAGVFKKDPANQEDHAAQPPLPAPVLREPECGSIIPRPTNDALKFSWHRVEKASTYTVEVDCFGCFGKREWHSLGGAAWHLRAGLGLRSPIYSSSILKPLQSDGGLAIRWRAWAVDHNGRDGIKSDWCQVSFVG